MPARHGFPICCSQGRLHLAYLHPRLGKGLAHLLALEYRKDNHYRQRGENNEGQWQVNGRHYHKGADQQHNRNKDILGAVMSQLRNIHQVIYDSRHYRSGLVVVEIGEGQGLQVRKDIPAHIRLHFHAHDVPVI